MYFPREVRSAPLMLARLLVLLLLTAPLLGTVGVAPSAAQQNPFGPIAPAPEPEPAPTAFDPEDDSGGLSEGQTLLIAGAAFLLLVGIAWAILRDARSAAPVEDRRQLSSSETDSPPRGTRPPKKQQVKTNRQKAKTARQARKRNARKR